MPSRRSRASSFWLGEYSSDEIATAPEFAVADSVISLGTRAIGDRSERVLEVLKLRGSDYVSGQHGYRLTSDGLDVFPRLADTRDDSTYSMDPERVSTGIPLLDEMLGDGYWPGSTTLCAGPSGIGKTLMGLHFITSGAAQGEPGVIASLQENPSQLARVARSFSWTLDGVVEVMYRSPVDIQIDEWIYDLLETVERIGARRVLIDSLADLQFASGDRTRFREYMYSLTQRFARAGVSVFMTSELADLFTVTRLSDHGVSHLSDNVLLLQYLRDGAASAAPSPSLRPAPPRTTPTSASSPSPPPASPSATHRQPAVQRGLTAAGSRSAGTIVRSGAESNRPTDGLHRPAGFEGRPGLAQLGALGGGPRPRNRALHELSARLALRGSMESPAPGRQIWEQSPCFFTAASALQRGLR